MNTLQQIPLFASLDAQTLAAFEAMSRKRHYRKGDILFFEGEHPATLTILTQGVLKLYKTSAQHKEIVLHHFRPVSLIAETALLEQIPYPATALFETDGTILSIDYTTFSNHVFSNPDLSRRLTLSLTKKIRTLEALIERNLVMDAAERICDLIATSPEVFGAMRQFEIAGMLNMTPETLSRTLKRLLHEGIIQKNGEHYTLT